MPTPRRVLGGTKDEAAPSHLGFLLPGKLLTLCYWRYYLFAIRLLLDHNVQEGTH